MGCPRGGQPKERRGEEITEQLDYVPASFIVRRPGRGKYACKKCQEGVVIADLPARPIEKGRPGEGLLAQALTSKYGAHTPLHRQTVIYRRPGAEVARSTPCDWVGESAALRAPRVEERRRQIPGAPKIPTDDTPVAARNGSAQEIPKGFLGTYLDLLKNVVFDYTPGHRREGPLEFLGDDAGYLQADAYKGYDAFFAKGRAKEVACWAHTRRKFFEAQDTDPARAAEMLVSAGDLYQVEDRAKEEGLDRDQIKALRQEESQPILEVLETRLELWGPRVLPKSPLGQAQGPREALNRYTDDGLLSSDNNLSEQVLRRGALGRKNGLFVGHGNGGHRAAILYRLVASCKLCGIDPFAYFRDVLERISTHPARRIAELLPRNWKPSRP
jgi:transposase